MDEKIKATGKNVLLVEGVDDVMAFGLFLDKVHPGQWERDWVVADAGNKKLVLDMLQHEPNWIGVVDRDEWASDIIRKKEQELANLMVLPRFCLENYLILSSELWSAFPQRQRDKIAGGENELHTLLTAEKTKWLRHGVLWSVINPLWEGLRSLGFKEDLLDPDISLNDDKIKTKLNDWHDYLNPDAIYLKFTDKLEQVEPLSESEHYRYWINGKKFYKQVVNQTLNQLLGQKDSDDRKKDIFRTLPAPDELTTLWHKMNLT